MVGTGEVWLSRTIARLLERIHAWCEDFFAREHIADLHDSDAVCIGFKNSSDYRGGFGVGDYPLRIVGVFHVTVSNCCSDTLSAFPLCPLDGTDFLARVAGVQVVEVVLDARKIIHAADRIHSIVDDNEPYIVLRKSDFHEQSCL